MTKLFRAKYINWQNCQHFLKLLNNMYFKSMFCKKQNNLWTIIIFFKHNLQLQYLRRKIVNHPQEKILDSNSFYVTRLFLYALKTTENLSIYIYVQGVQKETNGMEWLSEILSQAQLFSSFTATNLFWWLNQRRIQDPVKHLRWTVLRR